MIIDIYRSNYMLCKGSSGIVSNILVVKSMRGYAVDVHITHTSSKKLYPDIPDDHTILSIIMHMQCIVHSQALSILL